MMDENNVNIPQQTEQPQPQPVQAPPQPQPAAPQPPVMPSQPPVMPSQPPVMPAQPANTWQAPPAVRPVTTEQMLPPEYRPLSPWAYFGYQLLFNIPLVGFILLIVFSCSNDNINRRNFARSYWCMWAICLIVVLVVIVLSAIYGASVVSSTVYW